MRQLESMLRLAEALAKLYFSETITVNHVKEAHNLMKLSIVTIDREQEEMDDLEDEMANNPSTMHIDVPTHDEDASQTQTQTQSDVNEMDHVIVNTTENIYLYSLHLILNIPRRNRKCFWMEMHIKQ